MIRLIKEKSFRQKDIPKQFYLVTDFGYNVNIDELKKGVLKGVSGISGSINIVLDFMGVGRNLIIVMKGPSLININNVSRIMYNNPHYLVSNDLDALFRVFQDVKSGPDKYLYQHVFHNLFDYCRNFMESSSNKNYNGLLYSWKMSGVPAFDFNEFWIKEQPKINNLYDFTKAMINLSKQIDDYSGKESFEELSFQEVYDLFEGALNIVGEIYGDESEWVLKDKELNIPKKTKLIYGTGIDIYNRWLTDELTNFEKHRLEDRLNSYQELERLKKYYELEVIDIEKFRKIQSDIMATVRDWKEREDKLLNKYPILEI